MCKTPNKLEDGTLVACRKCWQCRENAVKDWVGRCIAEGRTAKSANSLTLTYGGGDTERAAVLTYSDVQKFFKRLRRAGYPMKYFAVGEYGSAKGRSHWHIIIYWRDKVPPHEIKRNFQSEFWPHGWSFWDDVTPASVRYVCKYLQKDLGKDERQAHFAMSKKPPLGHEYFQSLAQKYVDAGLAPQTLFYEFDEARDADGKKTQFLLKETSAHNFLSAFIRKWGETHGSEYPPYSELVEEFLDAQNRFDSRSEELADRYEKGLIVEAAREADGEIAKRAEFAKAHNEHYFGKNMRGFWELEDGEKREKEQIEDRELFQPPEGVDLS